MSGAQSLNVVLLTPRTQRQSSLSRTVMLGWDGVPAAGNVARRWRAERPSNKSPALSAGGAGSFRGFRYCLYHGPLL
jgi:hypothetical protein